MKILVPIKRVVDYAIRVHVNSSRTHADIENLKKSINPFCEVALEESLRIKQKFKKFNEIIVVSAGNDKAQQTLRQALAIGADRAILVETDKRTDDELQPLAVAKILEKLVLAEKPHLVLLGKQSIDDDSSQTGQMLAGLLNWPQATFASNIQFVNEKDEILHVTRELDEGLQILEVKLPCVITCDLRLNQPRCTKLQDIMKAKNKPLKVINADLLGIDLDPRLEVLCCFDYLNKKKPRMVKSVDELIDALKNEKKVIF